jgi:YebC/PmpR family DNA-binding regulatory protein
MSGHNKWAQIKHKKALTDAKRGQVFGKLARAISVTARNNPDPETNVQLQSLIKKAREINMPSENIKRALQKTTEIGTLQLEEIQLEILGPGDAAIIVNAITDNRNRTLSELRTLALRYGGKIAQEGSLMWMFHRVGTISLPLEPTSIKREEEIELASIEAGATDIQKDNNTLHIETPPEALKNVRAAIAALGIATIGALQLLPTSLSSSANPEDEQRLLQLVEALDDHDDVQDIISNIQC